MNILDRFLDFWETPNHYSYEYDLSIFEQILYGVIGGIIILIFVALGIVFIALTPVWGIPYMIYKNYKIKKDNHHVGRF